MRHSYWFFALGLSLALTGCSGSGGDEDAGAADARITDSGSDAGRRDADNQQDSGEGDASNPDVGGQDTGPTDMGNSNFPTLSDYRICQNDTDCPVGLGECVKTASYNRPDNGVNEVAIDTLFADVAPGEGVCSRGCSTDISACETLSLRDSTGSSVTFTCQVVSVGSSPYPDPAPAFPFDAQIDAVAMTAGRPFAAICRPPFELDTDHINNFCGACTGEADCDGGTCWRFDIGAAATSTQAGTCLEPEPASGCPRGFTASDIGGLGAHCVPDTDTCGPCQDRDLDERGAGHCASSAVDCDDTNASAYYDDANPDHAFPTFCGGFDFNCNGLSDDSEQIGVEAYKAFHCEACGDDFDGQTVNAGTPAEAVLECAGGVMQVAVCADATRVNCGGDPRVVGCDSTVAGGGQTYYRDMDGDTFGDPNVTSLGCPAGPPSGFVANSDDCDDTTDLIRPGVPDVCECWGDCEQASARVDNDCDGSFDEDVTNYTWYVDGDMDGAGAARVSATQYCGAPTPGAVFEASSNGATATDCDDTRTDVAGPRSLVADAAGIALPLPVTQAPPRDAMGELYVVSDLGVAEICDGLNNNCAAGTDEGVTTRYYRDMDTDTYGDPNVFLDECSLPTGYVVDNTDCNDGEININPAAMEICNGVDDNCVNGQDEGVPLGAACTINGQVGLCAMGTETSCNGGVYQCSPVDPNAPLDFDDPATAVDEDCDGAEVIIYVDPMAPTTTNGRTPAQAVRDIGTAMLRAADNPVATQIHLLGGTMNTIDSQVDLRNGVDIVGGAIAGALPADPWTYGTAQSFVQRTGGNTPGGREIAFFGNGVQATLARMDILVATPTDMNDGVDVYGIALRGNGMVRLQDIALTVNAGTNGPTGADGADGADGANAGIPNGGSRVCSGTNVSGGIGGFFTPGGDGLGPAGGGGASAGNNNGSAGGLASGGSGGSTLLPVVSGDWWQSNFITGATNGGHGSGGGGGSSTAVGLIAGGGGSGGCRGNLGGLGTNGGSAFGIFSIASNFELVSNVTITVSGAGDGGDGGAGGDGGDGGNRAGSSPRRGGSGSGGGGGGGGAGGNGGDAYVIFQSGGNNPCDNADVIAASLNLPGGVGGAGGTGGARGNAGRRGNTGTFSANGSAGLNGYGGQNADCFWSQPCGSCPGGQQCISGRCYFTRVRQP